MIAPGDAVARHQPQSLPHTIEGTVEVDRHHGAPALVRHEDDLLDVGDGRLTARELGVSLRQQLVHPRAAVVRPGAGTRIVD